MRVGGTCLNTHFVASIGPSGIEMVAHADGPAATAMLQSDLVELKFAGHEGERLLGAALQSDLVELKLVQPARKVPTIAASIGPSGIEITEVGYLKTDLQRLQSDLVELKSKRKEQKWVRDFRFNRT